MAMHFTENPNKPPVPRIGDVFTALSAMKDTHPRIFALVMSAWKICAEDETSLTIIFPPGECELCDQANEDEVVAVIFKALLDFDGTKYIQCIEIMFA